MRVRDRERDRDREREGGRERGLSSGTGSQDHGGLANPKRVEIEGRVAV